MAAHYKHQPRDDEEIIKLKHRIHRITGQLNGIEKMLDENRYCGDILIQIAAVQKALESLGYIVLSDHLKTCVTQDVLDGKSETMDEVMDMIKKLK